MDFSEIEQTNGLPPQASVVVPSYNRPAQLRRCLAALCAQEGVSFEVVVVDDGSAQPLSDVCAEFAPRVRAIRQENSGPAVARNRGAAEARGAFLAFTDDDCLPRPDWLAALVKAHGGRDDVLVGGRVENGLPEDPFASASQDLCDYLYDYFGAAEGRMPFFTSNNIGMSRAGFDRIGGFDDSFALAAAEDRDFGLRWREQGGALIYAEDAIIDHFHGMTLRKFWRQHTNYGQGAWHLHRVLDRRGSDQPKREPLAFYVGLVLQPVKSRGLAGLKGTTLMALTQIAMINGYGRAMRAAR